VVPDIRRFWRVIAHEPAIQIKAKSSEAQTHSAEILKACWKAATNNRIKGQALGAER
jgi:hypothetical protein